MKESWKKTILGFLGTFGAGLLLGAILAGLQPVGFSLEDFLGAGALVSIALVLMMVLWRWGGKTPRLGWMMVVGFLLRLVIGVGLSLALPIFGHDTPTSQAGYIFLDAFRRDGQAWSLAQSGQSLWIAFGDEFYVDQYGGMLAVSAAIYRIFSPDNHQPWLIIIFTAFSTAAGVVFLYRGLVDRFGLKIASLASWIYVLYPESILLGGAQMRDPVLIGLAVVAFWAVSTWREKTLSKVAVFLMSILIMAAFSWLVALPILGVLLLWWWIEYSPAITRRWLQWAGWLAGLAAGLAGLVLVGGWLVDTATWDARLTALGSGWVQKLFTTMPEALQTPFIIVYGIAQPILPAALLDPSLPLWNGISTFRSVGWYLLLPLLMYVPFALRRLPAGTDRRLLSFTFAIVVVWVIMSSYRAGGDLWDNPRYRTLFIPWLAIISAWAWTTGRQTRDAWLGRWYLVEGLFLFIFGVWYANRSFQLGLNIPFWGMVAAIVGLGTLVLVTGGFYDYFKSNKKQGQTKSFHLDPRLTIRSIRMVFILGVGFSLLSLIPQVAFLGVLEPWFEVLRPHHRLLVGLSLIFFLSGLVLSFTRLWTTIVTMIERFLHGLNQRRWVAVGAMVFLTLPMPVYQIYAQTFIKLRPYLPPLLVFGFCVLVGGLIWWSIRPAKGVQRGLGAAALFSALIYLIALQLPKITNYPFSIEWSEGSRLYEASQIYSAVVYGIQLPLPLLDVGRGILQGLPFVFPGLTIGFHRFWLQFLELGTTFLAVFLLAWRCKISDRFFKLLFILWGFLFLYQGPIFHHLLVVVFLVLWRFDREKPWKSLLWVILATIWAGLTRINWFPMAGFLAALLYFIEVPVGKRTWVRYLAAPTVYTVAGSLIAFASYLAYISISGNPPANFGTSLRSTLLWERLWPNATFAPGILLAIVFVSLPLLGWVVGRIVRSRGGWQPIRVVGIVGVLLVFFVGGIVVSMKVGGGNNLHNLDAFLFLLLTAGSLVLFDRFVPDNQVLVKPQRWSTLWLGFLVLVPVGYALITPVQKKLPEERVAFTALQSLQRSINRVSASQKPILFIGNRQLLAFKQVQGVEIVAPYERVILSEMAMANNQVYLDTFYSKLAEHYFGLIVMEPMNLRYQDDTYRFAFENNLFIDTIFKPINEHYQEDVILREVGISTYRPRP